MILLYSVHFEFYSCLNKHKTVFPKVTTMLCDISGTSKYPSYCLYPLSVPEFGRKRSES